MLAILVRFNKGRVLDFLVPAQRLLTYTCLVLIGSMFFVPQFHTTPYPASLAQLVNRNQHILWQYSYTGTLRLAQISSRGETIAFVTDTFIAIRLKSSNTGKPLIPYRPLASLKSAPSLPLASTEPCIS